MHLGKEKLFHFIAVICGLEICLKMHLGKEKLFHFIFFFLLRTLKSSWENTIFEMESEADIHR